MHLAVGKPETVQRKDVLGWQLRCLGKVDESSLARSRTSDEDQKVPGELVRFLIPTELQRGEERDVIRTDLGFDEWLWQIRPPITGRRLCHSWDR
jgi:hypothetical protein